MQLVYYHRKGVPNFGDDLNVVLWKGLAPDLFDDDLKIGFVGIGTIIGMPCGEVQRLHVFSSGIGYDRPEGWRGKQVEYWCVRGPISAHVLGLPEDRAITDGAILTPLVEGFPKAATGGSSCSCVGATSVTFDQDCRERTASSAARSVAACLALPSMTCATSPP